MQIDLDFNSQNENTIDILSKYINGPITLQFTKNKTRILSSKRIHDVYKIRLHQGFEFAPKNIIEDIANIILNNKKQSSASIHKYYQAYVMNNSGSTKTKKRKILTLGKYFDLKLLFEEINNHYFNGSTNADITWGYKPRFKKRYAKSRHITLGQYSKSENLITIHPNLDRRRVPKYFIESVIHHEICHILAGEKHINNRRLIHTNEFKRLENTFIYKDEAKKWEKENFNYLIRNIWFA